MAPSLLRLMTRNTEPPDNIINAAPGGRLIRRVLGGSYPVFASICADKPSRLSALMGSNAYIVYLRAHLSADALETDSLVGSDLDAQIGGIEMIMEPGDLLAVKKETGEQAMDQLIHGLWMYSAVVVPLEHGVANFEGAVFLSHRIGAKDRNQARHVAIMSVGGMELKPEVQMKPGATQQPFYPHRLPHPTLAGFDKRECLLHPMVQHYSSKAGSP